jgi:hypothetical protein
MAKFAIFERYSLIEFEVIGNVGIEVILTPIATIFARELSRNKPVVRRGSEVDELDEFMNNNRRPQPRH